MRELKFRAWNNDRNEFEGWDSLTCMSYSVPEVFCQGRVLEQSTGFDDNRNVEIYEGDILRWEWLSVRVGIVEFRNYTDDDGGLHRGWVVGEDTPLPDVVAGRGGCVIIGNIHETPKDEKGYPL